MANKIQNIPEDLQAIENHNVEVVDRFLSALVDGTASQSMDDLFTSDTSFTLIDEEKEYSDENLSHEPNVVLPWIGSANNLEASRTLVSEFSGEFDVVDIDIEKYVAQQNDVAVIGRVQLENTQTGNLVVTPLALEVELNDEGKIQFFHAYMDTYTVAAASRAGGTWKRIYGEENGFLDTIFGTNAGETLAATSDIPNMVYGYDGDDSLLGGANDDHFYGGGGNDEVNGGGGNDQLWGNSGNNTLAGGAGSDTFVLTREGGVNTITDFVAGEDTLGLFGDITFENLVFTQNGNNVAISFNDTGEQLATLTGIEVDQVDSLENFEIILGSSRQNITYRDDAISARKEQPLISPEEEQRNSGVVAEYLASLLDGTTNEYIDKNFAPDAQYTLVQDNNNYSDENPFSNERYTIQPSTKLFIGTEGVKEFIGLLTQENTPINLQEDKIIVENNNVVIFGSFEFENNRTGNRDGTIPIAIDIELTEDGKIDSYHLWENSFEFNTLARVEGSWTRKYAGTTLDIAFGSSAGDILAGGEGEDQIYGYAGSDALKGGGGDDVLYGGSGNDLIDGGDGSDSLFGNKGSDRFVLAAGEGTDTINDFEDGVDLLALPTGLTFEDLTIAQDGNNVAISVTDMGERLATLMEVNASVIDADDLVPTSDGAPDLSKPLFGTVGDDVLEAGFSSGFDGSANLMFANEGADLVDATQGVTGRNRIYGGSGGDELYAGQGDRLFSGDGNDILDASQGQGNNRLYGGHGDDELYAGRGDRLIGGDGNDILDASQGQGNNRLYGGHGDDELYAGRGDHLIGGDGNDRFFILTGGDNILTGGDGADQLWIANSELPDACNTITDFELGTDVIGISGLGITFKDFSLTQDGADTIITASEQNLAILLGIQATSLNATNFMFIG